MKKTIWKFELNPDDTQSIEMPEFAQILCIQTQNLKPCLWALVEPENRKVKRTFEIFGTGYNIPSNRERQYIGTFQTDNGFYVFHCFELIRTLQS